jgi:hypothetical protein
MADASCENELFLLVELAMTGRADESQLRRLNSMLESNPEARELYARAWMLDVDLRQVYRTAEFDVEAFEVSAVEPRGNRVADAGRWKPHLRQLGLHHSAYWVAAAVLLAGLVGYLFGHSSDERPVAGLAIGDGRQDSTGQVESGDIHFRLTKASRCVWGESSNAVSHFQPGGVHGGESLELLEGFATFALDAENWDATVQIEGPAAIVVTSQELPALRQGQMLVNLTSAAKPLSIGLPFAEVHLMPGSEVGVVAYGGLCEVHVFKGLASIKSLWNLSSRSKSYHNRTCVVAQGSSIALEAQDGNLTTSAEGAANRGMFDPAEFMKGGQLVVTKKYVDQVVAAQPVAYWRFEDIEDGVVRNTIQDRFDLAVHGDLRVNGLTGNRYLNFTLDESADHQRYLYSLEPITTSLPGDYAIECWINPSHYHTSTLLAFLISEVGRHETHATWNGPRASDHGMLVEIGGFSGDGGIMQPRKVRYVHRNPVGFAGGKATYSNTIYKVREWQHVVCQKEGDVMRVFLNGKQCSQAKDPKSLAPDLIAVIGQISDARFERSFYGQLDELAIYDRALTADEITEHYDAAQFIGRAAPARPKSPPRPAVEL